MKAGDYYRFRLVSDDGAILYIDGYPVIDNDGQHPPVSKQATIQLAAGEHEALRHLLPGAAGQPGAPALRQRFGRRRELLGPAI